MEVSICAPDRVVGKFNADGITLPGLLGYMTILKDHTAMVSELEIGEVLVRDQSGSHTYFIAGGYVEVAMNVVSVLADVIERSDQIDATRASEAKNRAEALLASGKADFDVGRAQRALKRAHARLAIARPGS